MDTKKEHNDIKKESSDVSTKYEVSSISPHNKAVYEAGKKLLIDSIETGKDFCKSMISITLSAIPIYIAILRLVGIDKIGQTSIFIKILCFITLILFLSSSITYIIGYFPITNSFSLDLLNEIEEVRNRIINRRKTMIVLGTILFFTAIIITSITFLIL